MDERTAVVVGGGIGGLAAGPAARLAPAGATLRSTAAVLDWTPPGSADGAGGPAEGAGS